MPAHSPDPTASATAPGAALRSIAILGGGVTGWSVAAALAARLRAEPRCAIRLITLASAADPLAISALPTARHFHAELGLDEDALLRATRGTFKLGARYAGWSPDGAPYFEPFGEFGASFGGAAFHHVILKLRQQGQAAVLTDFSLAAVAAGLGRFSRPSDDPRSVLSTLAYALHLDGGLYAQALRAFALRLGAQEVSGEVAEVATRGEAVVAIRLADGQTVEADLFIDASGPEGRLLQALGVGWEDWSWSPFDGLAEVIAPAKGPPAPFTEVTADAAGWRASVPLQGAAGVSYLYSRDAIGDDAAAAALSRRAPGAAAADVRLSRIGYGRRERAWVGNCVAIGAAAGTPGPMDLGLHLAHSGALRLLGLLPPRGHAGPEADEFNRQSSAEMERLRDFAVARLRVNGRRGEPLWDRLRATPGPESLEYKLALFESRGRTVLLDEEVFPEASWVGMLTGLGVWPRRHDFRIDALDAGQLESQLRRMRATIAQAAQAMPEHAEFLRRCGGAVQGAGAPGAGA